MKNELTKTLAFLIALVLACGYYHPLTYAAEQENRTIRVGYIDYDGFIEPQENGDDIAIVRVYGDYTSFGELSKALEEKKIEACCTTKIITYPRSRICAMPLIAGTKMKNWLSSEETIVAWAKERNCTQIEGYARDGWLRVLKHWSKVWTTIRRDI